MMLHKTLLSFAKIDVIKHLKRSSSLFRNGPKSTENFLYITPHINMLDYMNNKQRIQQELLKRQSNYDLTKLEDLWSFYDDLKTRKLTLDVEKEKIKNEIAAERVKTEPNGTHIEKLKIHLDLIKDNIKQLKVPFWSAEETAIIEALKLPNSLHCLTPDGTNKIIYEYGTPSFCNKHHMTVAIDKNLLQYNNCNNYYLMHDAAVFELGAKWYFGNYLQQNKFLKFSNPDFTRSLVVEGCGLDHTDANSTFIIRDEDSKDQIDDRLHLTGAASIFSFFAYHTKNVLRSQILPLKYFSNGRKYSPVQSEENNLFNVSQSAAVEIFVVAKNANEGDKLLSEIVKIIKDCYGDIGYHFRLSYVPANKLQTWQSLRIAIEMYSGSLKDYVEIGNVSISGDFICKRLMLTYMEGKNSHFPYIISGTLLNVPKLLACVLEQEKDFSLPHQFRVENWRFK